MANNKKLNTSKTMLKGIVIDSFKVKKKKYEVGDKFSTKDINLFNNLITLNKIKK